MNNINEWLRSYTLVTLCVTLDCRFTACGLYSCIHWTALNSTPCGLHSTLPLPSLIVIRLFWIIQLLLICVYLQSFPIRMPMGSNSAVHLYQWSLGSRNCWYLELGFNQNCGLCIKLLFLHIHTIHPTQQNAGLLDIDSSYPACRPLKGECRLHGVHVSSHQRNNRKRS